MAVLEVLSKNVPVGSEGSVRNRIQDDATIVFELEDIDLGRYVFGRHRYSEAGEGISERIIRG